MASRYSGRSVSPISRASSTSSLTSMTRSSVGEKSMPLAFSPRLALEPLAMWDPSSARASSPRTISSAATRATGQAAVSDA